MQLFPLLPTVLSSRRIERTVGPVLKREGKKHPNPYFWRSIQQIGNGMYLKKFDRLLITSFIPVSIVTFFIALFVFVLQTLWLYIDDIAGKGVGFFLLVELVGYMSVSLIPMALPVAVLISSVMVLGNMAERYELSSIKSAGVSLWRVMRPLMVLTLGISVFSFFCSNFFIPVSNLKFKSRLYDIRKQKPTLSLEESVFNDDFQGYSIRLGNKLPDGKGIGEVLLYDNSEASQGRLSAVAADSGRMSGSEDGKFFVMQLYNGNQYMEPKPTLTAGKRNYPLMRTSFKEWTKVFDLDEFNFDRTDENLFKSHHTMLSNRQLLVAIDSINKEIETRIERNTDQVNRFFYFLEKQQQERLRQERQQGSSQRELTMGETYGKEKHLPIPYAPGFSFPSAMPFLKLGPEIPVVDSEAIKQVIRNNPALVVVPSAITGQENNPNRAQLIRDPNEGWPQEISKDLADYKSILETFSTDKRAELLERAKTSARTAGDQAESTNSILVKTKESKVKHVFEFNSKFSMALACFIFLFIGAPMGAIVRKGGFGWPLLISIVFFMLFIVITIFSKSIAERFVIHAVLASWLNCLIIFPMGLTLTYWAMRDVGMQQLMDYFKVKIPPFKRKA